MFCAAFFAPRFFAPRFFAKVGSTPSFKPEWAANSNSYLGPSLAQPVNK